jgi:hypothetical protein
VALLYDGAGAGALSGVTQRECVTGLPEHGVPEPGVPEPGVTEPAMTEPAMTEL